MKKLIILTAAVSMLFISGCSCSIKKDDENNNNGGNPNIITDENVVGVQNVNGILFENTTFQVENGVTTIVTKVTNTNPEEFKLENYQMTVTDSAGNITILTSTVGETLAPNTETSYPTSFALDLIAASKVEYKVNVTG